MSGVGAIPAPQPAFILLLPDEILALIGRAVAPHGGKACCKLGLVNRRLRAITKPIIQSAIRIPAPQDQHEAALASLAAPATRRGVTSATYYLPPGRVELSVFSLVRFTSITELALHGTHVPPILLDALVELGALRTLRLEGLAHLTRSMRLDERSPSLRTLVFSRCSFAGLPVVVAAGFVHAGVNLSSTKLSELNIQTEGKMTGPEVAGCFQSCSSSLRRLTVGWSGQPPANVGVAFSGVSQQLLSI
ncbi:hypothetical protein RQP46_001948 [Phenoliferia psychrophenolica]